MALRRLFVLRQSSPNRNYSKSLRCKELAAEVSAVRRIQYMLLRCIPGPVMFLGCPPRLLKLQGRSVFYILRERSEVQGSQAVRNRARLKRLSTPTSEVLVLL